MSDSVWVTEYGSPNAFSSVLRIPKASKIGVTVSHPAATTTTYQFLVSDSDPNHIATDQALWVPYPVKDPVTGAIYDSITKNAAGNFGVTLFPPHKHLILLMNTTVGNGLILVEYTAYPVTA